MKIGDKTRLATGIDTSTNGEIEIIQVVGLDRDFFS